MNKHVYTVCGQIFRTCYVELKRTARALVKYVPPNSAHAKFYELSQVQLVSCLLLQPTNQQHGFAVEFSNSDTLVFYCNSRTSIAILLMGSGAVVFSVASVHRRSQDFLWGWGGALFLTKNQMTFFMLIWRYIFPPLTFLSHFRGCTSPNSPHFPSYQ